MDHACDAFVEVSLDGDKRKTPVVYDDLNPTFNKTFSFDAVWPAASTALDQRTLMVEVRDQDMLSES